MNTTPSVITDDAIAAKLADTIVERVAVALADPDTRSALERKGIPTEYARDYLVRHKIHELAPEAGVTPELVTSYLYREDHDEVGDVVDGPVTVTTSCGVTVMADAWCVWPLTSCCDSAVSGSDRARCRACLTPVPSGMAGGPHTAVHAAVVAAGCPCPDTCTVNALWRLAEQRRVD